MDRVRARGAGAGARRDRAREETWGEPGGGGAVTAVQLAKLGGRRHLLHRARRRRARPRAFDELTALGLRVEAAWRDEPQRRGFVYVDAAGERTITVIGERLGPSGEDDLAWGELDGADAAYFTAGDASAVHAARSGALPGGHRPRDRAARRGRRGAGCAGGERHGRGRALRAGHARPRAAAGGAHRGRGGGTWERAGGGEGRYAAAELPGPVADAYGCGDSFAGGLAYGLGAGMDIPEALELAARCGAGLPHRHEAPTPATSGRRLTRPPARAAGPSPPTPSARPPCGGRRSRWP